MKKKQVKVIFIEGCDYNSFVIQPKTKVRKDVMKKIKEFENEFDETQCDIYIEGELIKKEWPKNFNQIVVKKKIKKKITSQNQFFKNIINSKFFSGKKFSDDYSYIKKMEKHRFFEEDYISNLEYYEKDLVKYVLEIEDENNESENSSKNKEISDDSFSEMTENKKQKKKISGKIEEEEEKN